MHLPLNGTCSGVAAEARPATKSNMTTPTVRTRQTIECRRRARLLPCSLAAESPCRPYRTTCSWVLALVDPCTATSLLEPTSPHGAVELAPHITSVVSNFSFSPHRPNMFSSSCASASSSGETLFHTTTRLHAHTHMSWSIVPGFFPRKCMANEHSLEALCQQTSRKDTKGGSVSTCPAQAC